MNPGPCLESFRVKEINYLVVTGNKLANNFAGLIASGPDVAFWPPPGPPYPRL
jgi:hypothetical protein